MPDVTDVSLWAWPAGFGVIIVALKLLWPILKSSTDTIVARNGAESGILGQTVAERDKALARADAADERADKYFMELADMKSQVKLLTLQLELANKKIDTLTSKLDVYIKGGHDA